MCHDVRMEYRYSAGRRVSDSLLGLIGVLTWAFIMVVCIMTFVDPEAIGSPGERVNIGSVALFCILVCAGTGLAYRGVWLARSAITDHLVVTSDGLVSREVGLIRVRATTIPWSSVTSFTVTGSGPRGYRQVVQAILDSGQQVKLPGTARMRVAAAATIAEELTTKLREHRHDFDPAP